MALSHQQANIVEQIAINFEPLFFLVDRKCHCLDPSVFICTFIAFYLILEADNGCFSLA